MTRALSLAAAQLDRAASASAIIARPVERLATALVVARGVSAVLGGRSPWLALRRRAVSGPRTSPEGPSTKD